MSNLVYLGKKPLIGGIRLRCCSRNKDDSLQRLEDALSPSWEALRWSILYHAVHAISLSRPYETYVSRPARPGDI